MTITRRVAVALLAIAALTPAGCATGGLGFGGTPTLGASASSSASPAPTNTPSVAPTLSEKEALTARAKVWTAAMASNFEGVTETPEECVDAYFGVDLTDPELYRTRGGKESAGAFGPSMGTNPCEVSKNTVERSYRDAAFVIEKANGIAAADPKSGIKAIAPAAVALKVVELNSGPYQDRVVLADQVLGWYANPDHELNLVKKDGPYTSNRMNEDGTTTTTHGNKPSLVLVTSDRDTDEVVNEDRTDCGLQKYEQGIPPGYEVPPPGEEGPPKLDKKNVSVHPANTDDAPAVQWNSTSKEDDDSNKDAGGGTAPKVYVTPAAPAPTPTPRPSPIPEPKPTSEPVPSTSPTCKPEYCD